MRRKGVRAASEKTTFVQNQHPNVVATILLQRISENVFKETFKARFLAVLFFYLVPIYLLNLLYKYYSQYIQYHSFNTEKTLKRILAR